MNEIAENINLMKIQIDILKSKIEIEKLKYLENLRDKTIPIMQRWQLFMDHPEYTGKTVNDFDELDSVLLKVIIEEHSLSIDVFGLDVYVPFKMILMETLISETGEINKNELKEQKVHFLLKANTGLSETSRLTLLKNMYNHFEYLQKGINIKAYFQLRNYIKSIGMKKRQQF